MKKIIHFINSDNIYLEVIRWILLIPVAVKLAVLPSIPLEIFFKAADKYIAPDWITLWGRPFVISVFYSLFFFIGGLAIAPKRTNPKNILLLLTIFLSFFTGTGFYFVRNLTDLFDALPTLIGIIIPIGFVWGMGKDNNPKLEKFYYKNLVNILSFKNNSKESN